MVGRFFLALLLRFLERHQVEFPAGQFAREPHVLAGAPDRLREIFLVDHDVHAVLFFVDRDLADFGRRQRVDHELRRILRPQNDVDALAAQFRGHRLHARTAHADAGADRIDARIVRLHRDLGARTRVARSRLDFEQSVLEFRHFEFEQLDQELRRDARQNDLRPAAGAIDFPQIGAHAIAGTQVFLRDHLVARQQRLDAARLDDRVAALHALDDAGDQVLFARQKIAQDLLALGIADFLQDDLLRGLRADAAEFDRLAAALR